MSYSALLTALACILVIVLYKLHESKSAKLRLVQLEFENYVKSTKSSHDEQNQQLEASKKESSEKLEQFRKQNELLESQLKDCVKNTEKLTLSEEKLTSDTINLMKKTTSFEKQTDQLKADLQKAQKHSQKLAQDYKFQLNTGIESLAVEKDSRIAELEELIATAERKILQQKELFKESEGGKDEIIIELRRSQDAMQQKIEELENDNNHQIDKINQLTKDYDQQQKDLEELRATYKIMHEDYVKVSGDLDDTRKALVDLKERAEILVQSETKLNNELKETKAGNHSLSEEIDLATKELQMYQAFFKRCGDYVEDLKRLDPSFAGIAKHLEQGATNYEAVSSGEDYHSDEEYISDIKTGEVDQNEFAILTKKASRNTFRLIEWYVEELRARLATEKNISSKRNSTNIDLKKEVTQVKDQLSIAESRNVVVLSSIIESRKLMEDELASGPLNETKLKQILHEAYGKIEDSLNADGVEKGEKPEQQEKGGYLPSNVIDAVNGTVSERVSSNETEENEVANQKDSKAFPPDDSKSNVDNAEDNNPKTSDLKYTEVENTKGFDSEDNYHYKTPKESIQESGRKNTVEELPTSKPEVRSQDSSKPISRSTTPLTGKKTKQPLASMWESINTTGATSNVDSDFAPSAPVFKTVTQNSSTPPPTTIPVTKDDAKSDNESRTSQAGDSEGANTEEASSTEQEDAATFDTSNETKSNENTDANASNQGAVSEESESTLAKIDAKLHDDVIAEEKTAQDEKSLGEEEVKEDKEILSRYDIVAAESVGDSVGTDVPVDPLSNEPESVLHSRSVGQEKFEAFKRDLEDAKEKDQAGNKSNTQNGETGSTNDKAKKDEPSNKNTNLDPETSSVERSEGISSSKIDEDDSTFAKSNSGEKTTATEAKGLGTTNVDDNIEPSEAPTSEKKVASATPKADEEKPTLSTKPEKGQAELTPQPDNEEQPSTPSLDEGKQPSTSQPPKETAATDYSASVGTEIAENIIESREHTESVVEEVKDYTSHNAETNKQIYHESDKHKDDDANSSTYSFNEKEEDVSDEEVAKSQGSIDSESPTDNNDSLSLGDANDKQSSIAKDDVVSNETPTKPSTSNQSPSKTSSKSNSGSPTKSKSKKSKKKKSRTGF
ncbi:hypothetical protein CANMA_002367 [Candida margitis]|uniref:uncharacterized protein n=1 Tax=Candida margitis TaxID=1775924 RepID=UPI002227E430|nr:uncharacterized protein CANMA_002367 [Candida margitis]KAI5968376.1 hypothetical protein CANMA_002367 [Candida margitis]